MAFNYLDDDLDISVAGDLPNFRFQSPSNEFDLDDPSMTDATAAEQVVLPDVIRSFVVYFQKQMAEQNVYEVHAIYENSFNKLTERYYKNSPWPPAESIATLVDGDDTFLLMYKELYYRHIYSKLQPTLEQRFESWENYCAIFNLLLNAEHPVPLELPNQWLWDIIDEFIYQFQAFCQFRSKLKNKAEEEIALLKDYPQVWSVHKVLYYLDALISKSKIIAVLEHERYSTPVPEGDEEFVSSNLYKMLGYFSIIGLLRMHCLLGDYYLALKSIDPIDMSKKGLFTRVTACHITVHYYVGWSYLMMRRYVDAIKAFSTIITYISRTKQYHTRSYQYDQILKKNEQMYALLAMALCLCPQNIEENLHAVVREKYGDKMIRMQRGDESAYEELFSYACPKYISPAPPSYDDIPSNYNHQEAYKLQLKLFLNEVRQQQLLPTIRSYLKLYTTIGIPKLAGFLDTDEATFRTYLQCLKHKTHNDQWAGGTPLSGQWASASDVDFYVDQDMVHIADQKVTRYYGEFFIRQINKCEEIIQDIKADKK